MKKLLILVLITLLAVLTIFLTIQGISIGNVEILGVKGIQEKNSKLDETIQQAAKLVEKDYKQAVSDVQINAKKLQEEKKNYEDMTTILAEGETQSSNQIEKYEIEALWVKLGNHATSEGIVMQMDVIKGANSTEDIYNLRFTATGSYISITDFISAIENDSSLGFKIEEFKMQPATSGTDLQATFVCKDVMIKDMSQMINVTNNQNTNTADESNKTNTNNATNTTNTSNTNTTVNSSDNNGKNTNFAQ